MRDDPKFAVVVTGEELEAHFGQRARHYEARAAFFVKKAKELGDEIEAFTSDIEEETGPKYISNARTSGQIEAFRASARSAEHATRKFNFLKTHVDRAGSYYLDLQELAELELI